MMCCQYIHTLCMECELRSKEVRVGEGEAIREWSERHESFAAGIIHSLMEKGELSLCKVQCIIFGDAVFTLRAEICQHLSHVSRKECSAGTLSTVLYFLMRA
jgi:hypothetical protein